MIYEDNREQLSIQAHDHPRPDMLRLLERTVWGSGGTQYEICDLEEKLGFLRGASFVSLEKDGSLIGAYILLRKRIRIGDRQYPAFYRTLLALSAEIQGRDLGKLLVQKTREHLTPILGAEGLIYGYIEADNKRSLNVSRSAGYESLGTFQTTVFSRLRPQDDIRVRPLKPTEREMLEAYLYEQYADHMLLDFELSLDADRYVVLEEKGTVLAGVQVEPCHWRIRRLPGVPGFLLVHVLSKTPGLRRLFDARQCRFLKLGNLFMQPGSEAEIFPLIEAVLARAGTSVAMAFQDQRSPVYRRMASQGRFGSLNSAIDTQVHVMAALNGFSTGQRARCREMPLFISPMDVG